MNQTKRARRQGRRAGVGTGTTSLLMIFTVLCFATLAMLSLSTAASNQRIQQRGLDRTQNLSAARGQVAERVARLDAQWAELGTTATVADALALAQADGWEVDAESATISLRVPIDENNELLTELQIQPPGTAQRYTVLRQVSQLVGGWAPQDEGVLWDGT